MGILKNEKYKGDIRQGKTFTVDPISKRRLDNFGEEDQFYIRNHHEGIISNELLRVCKKSSIDVERVETHNYPKALLPDLLFKPLVCTFTRFSFKGKLFVK